MKTCKSCGQNVQDTENYCPRCGCGQFAGDNRRAQPTPQRPAQPQPNQQRPMQAPPTGFRSGNVANQPLMNNGGAQNNSLQNQRPQPQAQPQPQFQNFDNTNNQNFQPNQNNQRMQGMQPQNHSSDGVISIKEWAIIMVKLIIPIYNIIFLFKTITRRNDECETVRNYLIVYVAFLIAGAVLGGIAGATMGTAFASLFI